MNDNVEMNEMNDNAIEHVDNGVMGSVWEYVFDEPLILRYGSRVHDVDARNENNFVKSIRCSPSGCSFIYSSEKGMIEYVDLRSINHWYMGEEMSSVCVEELSPCKEFVHTEVVYGMEWYT